MDLVCAAVGLSSTSDDMPPAPVRIIVCRRVSWRSRYRRREYHRARWAAQMPRDAANLTMLRPSTGRVVESQTLFRLKLVGKGALCPTPMNPPEARDAAAEKVEMMRRNRPTQQNFTRSRTCVYFWLRARVT